MLEEYDLQYGTRAERATRLLIPHVRRSMIVQARKLIQEDELEALADGDELNQARQAGHLLSEWQEGLLNFPPTYKFRHNFQLPL